MPTGKECTFYTKLEDGIVQCHACRHHCKIHPGKRGICNVRQNYRGKLFLLVHSHPSAVHIDPIEKKPLYHVCPGAKIMSIGTAGCCFRCSFCQNWQLALTAKDIEDTEIASYESLPPETVIQICMARKLKWIAFTYNEPAIFGEYALDIARLALPKGIRCVYVTDGYESIEQLEAMKGLICALNIDLKSFSDKFYRTVCGGRLEPVLDTIRRAYSLGMFVEITTLLIPGENDGDEEIESIAKFISSVSPDIPWHLSAFHPDYKMMDHKRTPVSSLKRALEIGTEVGLKHIYIGNVGFEIDTKCPNCKEVLVKRSRMHLDWIEPALSSSGKCKCGKEIAGIWK
ncbi:Pyruvate-formate lyase-activating enzyme lateral transfer candidate [Aduncisulcus paluster]|uniref:Pyruvate-formate lyase-activating enzyme lateral transfer candidate n=1 Tax=Aduncisulcus paluster TaxID=2918883 RepID=A0ABQ5JQP1_9EUKA|nr:Pyruvate-formate lyase-activating enzyme lateral transfer candidate [Aduncisulcus paluster]